jgi:hypothetical protein
MREIHARLAGSSAESCKNGAAWLMLSIKSKHENAPRNKPGLWIHFD